MSSRKQPLRQARTNPTRNAAASRTLDAPAEKPKAAPGFFPGITHFTDAITALPKEMIRHSTMLKEVDAKIHGPEVALMELLATVPAMNLSQDDPADHARRGHFFAARIKMNEMLGSLDEKNHVLSTANETMEKLLARCESAWPLVEEEISEEARWGRLDHWAYVDKSAVEKKPTANPERSTRRADQASANAAAAAIAADAETAASRNDTRGKSHRKTAQVLTGHDSDLDGHKKTGQSHKRKPQDITSAPSGAGLGITHGSTQGNKRRKVEKPLPLAANSGVPMEKSLSAVFGTGGRNAPGSPREASIADTGRKKGKAAGAASNGRKRLISSLESFSRKLTCKQGWYSQFKCWFSYDCFIPGSRDICTSWQGCQQSSDGCPNGALDFDKSQAELITDCEPSQSAPVCNFEPTSQRRCTSALRA